MINETETIVDKDLLCKLLSKCDNYNKIEYTFNNLGISLVKDEEFRPVIDVFDDLAKKWKSLT